MSGQHVGLDERARVEQAVDPLPGGQLALVVLNLHRLPRAGVQRLLLAGAELLHPFLHGLGLLWRHLAVPSHPRAARAL